MLGAPDLDVIKNRLRNVHLEPWGPDDVRYVCVLFWDELGFRLLRNHVSADTWDDWHESSGQFWDLFLGGCYRYESAWAYGERALELAKADQPFYWSRRMSEELSQIMSESAIHAGAVVKPWSFTGPLELVTVGARRKGADFEIEWESLRAINVDARQLSEAVSYYTESHVKLDAEILPEHLPAPGDFRDDYPPRELLLDVARKVSLAGRLIRAAVALI